MRYATTTLVCFSEFCLCFANGPRAPFWAPTGTHLAEPQIPAPTGLDAEVRS